MPLQFKFHITGIFNAHTSVKLFPELFSLIFTSPTTNSSRNVLLQILLTFISISDSGTMHQCVQILQFPTPLQYPSNISLQIQTHHYDYQILLAVLPILVIILFCNEIQVEGKIKKSANYNFPQKKHWCLISLLNTATLSFL